jgi:hypothetical protein
MTKYYVSEAGCPWEPTNAQTLASAKRAARLMQRFQGTQVQVGIKLNSGVYMRKARLIVNALDMSDKGYWSDS